MVVDPQKLNDLAKSLYEHKLAVSMAEAMKKAEEILTGGKGEHITAGGVPEQPTPEKVKVTVTEEEPELSKEVPLPEVRPEAPVAVQETAPVEHPGEAKEEKEIEEEIAEIESPKEEAQDQAILDELTEAKEDVAESGELDQENVEDTAQLEKGLKESQEEVAALEKDFDTLKEAPKQVEEIELKEWVASKSNEWSEKKLPGQELLKDANKIYEEEAKEKPKEEE